MSKSALVVIDVQVGLVEGLPLYNAETLLEKISSLIARAREAGVDVIYVQHDGGKGHLVEAGTAGFAIHPAVAPREGEIVIGKKAPDAFFETTLDDVLRERGVGRLVVAGAMTQYCIDTSCRRAVSLGYDVVLAADAHGTCDNEVLKAPQTIAHHNYVLHQFDAGPREILVIRSAEIQI